MAAVEMSASNCQEDELADENENISPYVFLTSAQVKALLDQDVVGVQRELEKILKFKELDTNLKEAILLDYYVSGFRWGKERTFTSEQLVGFMGLLHVLMDNIGSKRMSLEENLKEFGRALVGIGQSHPDKKGSLTFFNVEQAKDIINYFKMSLFQHYKLYEYMFNVPRDEMVIGAEQVIEVVKAAETPFPAPLEEALSFEIYSDFIAPLPIAPKETIQAEINEKLRVQEEAK